MLNVDKRSYYYYPLPEQGKKKCQGFPATSLGYPDDVSARHDYRNPLGLDGSRGTEAGTVERVELLLGETGKVFELLVRIGNTLNTVWRG